MAKALTRRSLVKNAAVTGAAIAGGVICAGVARQSLATEGALVEPAADSSASDGSPDGPAGASRDGEVGSSALGDGHQGMREAQGEEQEDLLAWMGEPPEIPDDLVYESIETDVIVVGIGDSGTFAIRAAAEEGVRVLALEKSPTMNSTGSDCAVIDGEIQARYGRDGVFDKLAILNEHLRQSDYHCNPKIFRRWMEQMRDVFSWCLEVSSSYVAAESLSEIPAEGQASYIYPYFYPMIANYDFTSETSPCFPTSLGFSNFSQVMAENLQTALGTGNVDARYGHFVERLIVDDEGRCVGVYARNFTNGAYLKATAKRGVILATGDYANNPQMVSHFLPDLSARDHETVIAHVDAEGNPTNTGDGLRLGHWAGAAIEGWHAVMDPHTGAGAGPDRRGVIGAGGYLWLNLDGERFMCEDLPSQQVQHGIEAQPFETAFQLFDANWPSQLAYFPAAQGVACYYLDDIPAYTAAGLLTNVRSPLDIQSALDDGRCLVSDDIEELLTRIPGMNVSAGLETIAQYNIQAQEGADTTFGKRPSRLFPLNTPPFYAAIGGPAPVLACLGGLESDEECRVYDSDHNVLEGLFVCGGMQGGRFAHQYPSSLRGLSLSMSVFYGYVAGKNAALGV